MVDTSLSTRLAKSLHPLLLDLLHKPLPEELDRGKITRAAQEWIDLLSAFHEEPKKELKHKKHLREWIMHQLEVDWAEDMDDAKLKEATRIIQRRILGEREREAFARCQSREILVYLEAVEDKEWKALLHGSHSLEKICRHFEDDDGKWQPALLDHLDFDLNLLERVWGSRQFGAWVEKGLVPVLQAQIDDAPTALPLEKAVAKVWEFTKVEKCLVHAFPALLLGDLVMSGLKGALGNDGVKTPIEAIRNLLVQLLRTVLKEADTKELKKWVKALKV